MSEELKMNECLYILISASISVIMQPSLTLSGLADNYICDALWRRVVQVPYLLTKEIAVKALFIRSS